LRGRGGLRGPRGSRTLLRTGPCPRRGQTRHVADAVLKVQQTRLEREAHVRRVGPIHGLYPRRTEGRRGRPTPLGARRHSPESRGAGHGPPGWFRWQNPSSLLRELGPGLRVRIEHAEVGNNDRNRKCYREHAGECA